MYPARLDTCTPLRSMTASSPPVNTCMQMQQGIPMRPGLLPKGARLHRPYIYICMGCTHGNVHPCMLWSAGLVVCWRMPVLYAPHTWPSTKPAASNTLAATPAARMSSRWRRGACSKSKRRVCAWLPVLEQGADAMLVDAPFPPVFTVLAPERAKAMKPARGTARSA